MEKNPTPFCTSVVDGSKVWKNKSGKLHREDGPALIHPNGSSFWYKDGYLHRLDGPAVVYNGSRSALVLLPVVPGECLQLERYYYIEGVYHTKHEFDEYIKVFKLTQQATIEAGINTDF